MNGVAQWDNEYARLARIASQQRTQGLHVSDSQLSQQQGLARLDQSLGSLSISAAEIQRRRRLIQHLQNPISFMVVGGGGSSSPPRSSTAYSDHAPPQSQMAMAMRHQDDMLDDLASGVSRLRDQTQIIGDESRMHVGLLNDMGTNLDAAHSGLEAETKRAAKLKEDRSVWRLQMTVAGLGVLCLLLILIGLS
jgi:hypothetical protein